MTEPLASLPDRVRSALRAAGSPWAEAPQEPLQDKGLAHAHLRLVGTGVLARIPKQSQMRLAASDNLRYQAACFERASASGHAPRLHAVLAPSAALPRGALLVEEIVGRTAVLPTDLGAMVRALAAIHSLPLPAVAARQPLLDAADPLRALLEEVLAQEVHLSAAHVDSLVSQAVAAQLQRLRQRCDQPARPARSLISFDGHPGNFILRPDGRAVLVDLEKCRYSYPSLDLAHATLYTSTTWDIATSAELTLAQVQSAYEHWADAVGASSAQAALAWHVPLRRAMWLWSVTWCAKWRVLSGETAGSGAQGEDWSTEHSDAALVAHVRERVDHYLSVEVVEKVLAEFDALDGEIGT